MRGRPEAAGVIIISSARQPWSCPLPPSPAAHAGCAGGRAGGGGDGAEKSKFGCGSTGVWLGLAQRCVRPRVSAALAQVFNVSAWNVLNTTFYKGTLVKHLH